MRIVAFTKKICIYLYETKETLWPSLRRNHRVIDLRQEGYSDISVCLPGLSGCLIVDKQHASIQG